jgi:hypothetical protein
MCSWFSKNLGDAMLAGEELAKIEEKFFSIYGAATIPLKVAMFIRHESEGHLHCEVKLYLTPEAFILANEIDADPCKKPNQDGLSLRIGCGDVWPDLFNDSVNKL